MAALTSFDAEASTLDPNADAAEKVPGSAKLLADGAAGAKDEDLILRRCRALPVSVGVSVLVL